MLSNKVVGQPAAMNAIIPYIQMHQAGLSPDGRPLGVFLLLGPTGTGKTKTVEALAEVLHGNPKNLLRVDCGEFQLEHETAKLVGAPPGYLGHRETQPMLNQQKINSVASERSNVSLILFDEIEKAAPSMTRLLLGILDKATLRLGDNNVVNFEKTLIFLTSNLGAAAMNKELNPNLGFESMVPRDSEDMIAKIERIGLAAVRRCFSPEFINRIDSVISYHPLSADSLVVILEHQLAELQTLIKSRLGIRAFEFHLTKPARSFLLRRGTSSEYGARELKRTLHRHLIQPLAALISEGRIAPGTQLRVEFDESHKGLTFRESRRELLDHAC